MDTLTTEGLVAYANAYLIEAIKGGNTEQVKTSAIISIAANLTLIERHLKPDTDPATPRPKPNPTGPTR